MHTRDSLPTVFLPTIKIPTIKLPPVKIPTVNSAEKNAGQDADAVDAGGVRRYFINRCPNVQYKPFPPAVLREYRRLQQ